MTRPRLLFPLALASLCALPASPSSNTREKARIETTERFTLAANAVLRLKDSFGEVYIEGWDQPEVEVRLSKATAQQHGPEELDEALRHLDSIKITTAKTAENELTITTRFPSRNLFLRPLRAKSNLELIYRIKAPRELSLKIEHEVGEVRVKDIRGDLRITNGIGEIALALPETAHYIVDARVRIGDVSSAFGGTTERRLLIGASLFDRQSFAAKHLYLRVGIGDIQVKKIPEQPWQD